MSELREYIKNNQLNKTFVVHMKTRNGFMIKNIFKAIGFKDFRYVEWHPGNKMHPDDKKYFSPNSTQADCVIISNFSSNMLKEICRIANTDKEVTTFTDKRGTVTQEMLLSIPEEERRSLGIG